MASEGEESIAQEGGNIPCEPSIVQEDEDMPYGSYTIPGIKGYAGLTLTSTDSSMKQNRFASSPDLPSRGRPLSITRKPLMHPTMYARSFKSDDSEERCKHCADPRTPATSRRMSDHLTNDSMIQSAMFYRQRLYSRLIDLGDGESRLRIPDHVLPSSMFYLIPTKPEATQRSIVTIFAIWNTMMGTSLLSMPWGIGQSGFIFGLMTIVLVGLLAFYTAFRVLRSKDYLEAPVFEFSDVTRHYFGPAGEWVAVVFGLLAFVGGMMVYWVLMTNFLYTTGVFIHDKVIHDNSTNATEEVLCPNAPNINNGTELEVVSFQDLWSNSTSADTFERVWSPTKTTPFYLIVIIFPLMNFKSATFFTKFNCLGTASVIYLWILIIIKAAKWGIHMIPAEIGKSSFRITFPALTGMLSLAFFLHNAVITILRNNKNQEKNVRDLSIGYALTMATYIFVGAVFYASFPLPKRCISSNLLDNLPSDDLLAVVARTFLLFQMITVFPLLAYIFRVQILHTLFGNVWPGWLHVLFLNVLLVTSCVLISVFYPHIGDIIRYSGSLCGFVYVFLLPVTVHMVAMHRRRTLSVVSIILHSFIIFLGLANFISQFLITPSK